jgi:hypothetical protein
MSMEGMACQCKDMAMSRHGMSMQGKVCHACTTTIGLLCMPIWHAQQPIVGLLCMPNWHAQQQPIGLLCMPNWHAQQPYWLLCMENRMHNNHRTIVHAKWATTIGLLCMHQILACTPLACPCQISMHNNHRDAMHAILVLMHNNQ